MYQRARVLALMGWWVQTWPRRCTCTPSTCSSEAHEILLGAHLRHHTVHCCSSRSTYQATYQPSPNVSVSLPFRSSPAPTPADLKADNIMLKSSVEACVLTCTCIDVGGSFPVHTPADLKADNIMLKSSGGSGRGLAAKVRGLWGGGIWCRDDVSSAAWGGSKRCAARVLWCGSLLNPQQLLSLRLLVPMRRACVGLP